MHKRFPILTRLTLSLLFVVLLVHSVEAASEILVPIMLAILFAYLLYPLAWRLESWGLPRALADFGTVIIAFAIVIFALFLFYKQMLVFAKDLPTLKAQAIHNMGEVELYLEQHISFVPQTEDHWLQEKVMKLFETGQGSLATSFTATAANIGKVFILPFVIFFMLFYRERFGEFVLEVVPGYKHDEAEHVMEEISKVTKRYMGGLFIVVGIIATLNCITLSIIGIKYAIFLGILAAMFNFIPYFGTLFGAVIPITVTFLTNDSPKYALFVIIHFLLIQMLEHNLLTPKITGSQVRINPLFTLFSILIGALMFGVAGMFLAIPFTGMFKIFCEHVASLKPLAKLIGEPEKRERSLTPID